MRKLGFLGLLFFIYVHLAAQIVAPKISVLEDSYDFGKIPEGETVNHEFKIVNTGGDTLKILNVKASCGCTAAKPDNDLLLPGETTSIKVSFNSTRRYGQQRKYVYVFSNDPENPQIRLMFSAVVVANTEKSKGSLSGPRLSLSKNQHNFGNVKEGEVVSLSVYYKNNGTKELEISRVKSSCGCTATVLSDKILKPGESGSLKIDLDTSDRKGQFTRTITLFTNDSVQPKQTITLIVNIVERNS
ncbi:MAG: DUF1573 domain-containing protein [Melioribacteraceae bacterium]|nr:DUF1573 domain-containing protein [Melioribacteraceae bacterium]